MKVEVVLVVVAPLVAVDQLHPGAGRLDDPLVEEEHQRIGRIVRGVVDADRRVLELIGGEEEAQESQVRHVRLQGADELPSALLRHLRDLPEGLGRVLLRVELPGTELRVHIELRVEKHALGARDLHRAREQLHVGVDLTPLGVVEPVHLRELRRAVELDEVVLEPAVAGGQLGQQRELQLLLRPLARLEGLQPVLPVLGQPEGQSVEGDRLHLGEVVVEVGGRGRVPAELDQLLVGLCRRLPRQSRGAGNRHRQRTTLDRSRMAGTVSGLAARGLDGRGCRQKQRSRAQHHRQRAGLHSQSRGACAEPLMAEGAQHDLHSSPSPSSRPCARSSLMASMSARGERARTAHARRLDVFPRRQAWVRRKIAGWNRWCSPCACCSGACSQPRALRS